jgi:hypothetical protein
MYLSAAAIDFDFQAQAMPALIVFATSNEPSPKGFHSRMIVAE